MILPGIPKKEGDVGAPEVSDTHATAPGACEGASSSPLPPGSSWQKIAESGELHPLIIKHIF